MFSVPHLWEFKTYQSFFRDKEINFAKLAYEWQTIVIDIGKKDVLFKGQLRPVEMHAIDIQELRYVQEDDATGLMFIQFRFLYVQAFLATVRGAG